jgi:serine-type D-Ala-D-Ala carboxypeptidase (penicillin-binding protein 5/6)
MHGTRLLPLGAGSAILIIVVAFVATGFFRGVPPATAVPTLTASTGQAPAALPWPAKGEAAIGVQGMGVVAASPTPRPLPIASLVKVMTALVTLEAHPLPPGQPGPEIAVTDADEQAYQAAAANGESVVPVQSGETLSEYQALQALLVAAGDNIASLLARWVAGSEAVMAQRMNTRAVQLGMHQTHFVDASGISPANVGIPSDMVTLGQAAMANPVLAQIVAQPQATIPLMGDVPNFNTALGQNGIVGVKTGMLPPAGADFLFAGLEQTAAGPTMLVTGAVLGLPTQDDTFATAKALLEAARGAVHSQAVVTAGQRVGHYQTQWGSDVDLVATKPVTVPVWPGAPAQASLKVDPRQAPIPAHTRVGMLQMTAGGVTTSVPVATTAAIRAPDLRWRILRGL